MKLITRHLLDVEAFIVGEAYVCAAGKVLRPAIDGFTARWKKTLFDSAFGCVHQRGFRPTLLTSSPTSSEVPIVHDMNSTSVITVDQKMATGLFSKGRHSDVLVL